MVKDLYTLLGVSRNASEASIKKAYKQLCRKYHSDLAPHSPVSGMLEIQEAFRILSNPQQRRHYDMYLDQQEQKDQTDETPAPKRISLFADFTHYAPSLEEIYQSFMSEFYSLRKSKSAKTQELHLEIPLHMDEARKGGTFSVEVPVPLPCPRCNGTGQVAPFICSACNGTGKVESKRNILITFPSNCQDNTVLKYNLGEFNIPGIFLHIHLRIL